MSEIEVKLLEAVEKLTAEVEGLKAMQSDLWGAEEIAALLKLKVRSVQQSILNRKRNPTFPSPKILPTGGRRWVRNEVINWATNH